MLFVGLLLVFFPRRILQSSGMVPPTTLGLLEVVGVLLGTAGAALALWCILTFVLVGKGTPAPFDPPRRLVVAGPYRYVRNPMYIGAGLALAGAAMVYGSLPLLGYVGLFLLAAHAFVVLYEEPTLTRLFGEQYRAYQASVRRWLPRFSVMDRPDQRWLRAVLLLGVLYLVVGVTFATLAGRSGSRQMRVAWRLAAWVVSAAAFAAHIGYEHVRLRHSPRRTAVHAAMAVALGAFALAVAANVHGHAAASHNQRGLALALVAWPALCGLPAFVVALAAGSGLALIRRRVTRGAGVHS